MKFQEIIERLDEARQKTLKKYDNHGRAIMPSRKRAEKTTIDFSAADDFKYKGYECSVVESGTRYKWYIYMGNRIMEQGFADDKDQAAIDCKEYIDGL